MAQLHATVEEKGHRLACGPGKNFTSHKNMMIIVTLPR